MVSRPRPTERRPPAPSGLSEDLSNSLLCDVLAARAKHVARPGLWAVAPRRLPIVTVFNNDYALVGNLMTGALYKLPVRDNSRAALVLDDGAVYAADQPLEVLHGRRAGRKLAEFGEVHYVEEHPC